MTSAEDVAKIWLRLLFPHGSPMAQTELAHKLAALILRERKEADERLEVLAKEITALRDEAERAEAESARLREALKPFAAMAPHFVGKRGCRPHLPEHAVYEVASAEHPDATLTVGDFMRAAELVGRL